MVQTLRVCRICNQQKDLSKFSGKRHQCSQCRRSKYRGADCYTPLARRTKSLKRHYDLSIEQFDQMFKDQNGLCGICNKSPIDTPKPILNVDHCHASGKVRGLLCSKCNRALGLLGDTEESLQRAVDYIKSSK